MSGPAVLQDINKATGYTPNLGVGGSSNGQVYASTPVPSIPRPAAAPAATADPYAGEIAALNAQTRAIQAQIAAQPKLLSFNYAGTQAQAKSLAQQNVNPIYQQKLNDYLSQARVNEQRQQQDFNTANQLIGENLKNVTDANTLSGQRTTEDVATNLYNSANKEQQFQQDSGTAFDKSRAALAGNVAQSGLTTSGLGAQQQNEAVTNRNTQEGRQVEQFNQYRQAQDLFKGRTLEDLATSTSHAQTSAGEQQTAAKLSLDRYIQDYGADEGHYGTQTQAQVNQNALDREAAVLNAQHQYYSDLLNQYLGSQKGARGQDLALTRSVYGV
jgi:hypothetical protein